MNENFLKLSKLFYKKWKKLFNNIESMETDQWYIHIYFFYFQAAFDWPLGPLGKIKQRYKSKSSAGPAVKSKSDENISGTRRLKRRSSERHGKSRKVAFEDQQCSAWWNYPLRLMKNATNSASTSTTSANKKRRQRHYTDPESRKTGGDWESHHEHLALDINELNFY